MRKNFESTKGQKTFPAIMKCVNQAGPFALQISLDFKYQILNIKEIQTKQKTLDHEMPFLVLGS